MNKKLFLGAILLGAMTVSTGALTSCIDNDEPEGITNLRGAKAELLRAKAAVELAKAELTQQQVNLAAIQVKLQEALHATLVSREEAITAEQWAKASQAEAEASQEWAEAEKLWAEANYAWSVADEKRAAADAAIAKIKAQLEVDLQNIQTLLLQAKNNYENVTAEIEAAKAVLTDAQALKLAQLQVALDSAWGEYKKAQSAVLTAMDGVFDAVNDEEDNIEGLQRAVVSAKAKLLAVNAAYDELKALAEDATPTAWETRMDSLKTYSDKTAPLEKAELDLKMEEIKQSAEYKAADKEDKAALKAYIAAQQNYNYLADGNEVDCFSEASVPTTEKWGYYSAGTHPTESAYTGAKKYDLDGANIAISNPTAFAKLQAAIDPTYLPSLKNDWKGMRFEVDGVKDDKGLLYSQMKNAFVSKATSGNPVIAKTVAAWEEALKNVKVTDEDIAADICVADFEKAVADAQKAHNEAVAKWEKAHKTYAEQAVETSVSTDDFKAAIKKYNDNIDALETAVTTYNETYDATLTSLYNKELEKTKIEFAETEIDGVLAASPAVGGVVGDRTSLTQIDALIESSTLTAAQKTAKKTDYKTAMNNKWATKTLAQITTAEKDAMDAAKNAVVSEDAVVKAGEKISKSDGSGILDKIKKDDNGWVNNAYTGSYATIKKAVGDFVIAAGKNSEKQTSAAQTASTVAKQESYTGVADADAKKYIKGGNETTPTYVAVTTSMWVEPKYELDDAKNYVDKGHKVLVRTKVSDAAIQAMTAVELDKQKAAENWVNYSAAAFGTDVPATISLDTNGKVLEATNARHTELTEALINKTTSPYKDENGKDLTTWATSSFKTLLDAKQALAKHQNLEGVNAEIESLKKQVAEAKAAIQKQIAGYTKAVLEANAAIDPAKKEHQAKHNAAYALIADVAAEIQAITDKTNEYNALATKLQAILNAYYNTVEFSYTDENGTEQKLTFTSPKDFSKVEKWLKEELAKYEKKDDSYVGTATRPASEGKIKDAEFKVASAEKALERGTADDEFDTVALKKLALEQAQAELEVAKTRYDYALSQLNAYVAALAQ